MKIGKNLGLFLTIFLSWVATCALNAQQKDNNLLSKIQAQRVAFFTEKMEITPGEAQKFWPLYYEYSKKKNLLVAEKTRLTKLYASNSTTMSNNDVAILITKYIQVSKEETSLFEAYNAKFLSVLPAHKVMKLYIAEVQFKQWLLSQIREKGTQGDDINE